MRSSGAVGRRPCSGEPRGGDGVPRVQRTARWPGGMLWGEDGAHLAVADLFPHVNVPGQRRTHAPRDGAHQGPRAARRPACNHAAPRPAAEALRLRRRGALESVSHPSRPHPWMGGQMYTMTMECRQRCGTTTEKKILCVGLLPSLPPCLPELVE